MPFLTVAKRGVLARSQPVPTDIFHYILGFCDARDLVRISQVARVCYDDVRAHVARRVTAILQRFVQDPTDLQQCMKSCDAVLTGTAALHVVMGFNDMEWYPSKLCFAVPEHFARWFVGHLGTAGYHAESGIGIPATHRRGVVAQYTTLYHARHGARIDVITSKTPFAFDAVLAQPITALQNFVSHNTVCVLYPMYTLNYDVVVRDVPDKYVLFDIRQLRAYGFRVNNSNHFLRAGCGAGCTLAYRSFTCPAHCVLSWDIANAGPRTFDDIPIPKDAEWRFDITCSNIFCDRRGICF